MLLTFSPWRLIFSSWRLSEFMESIARKEKGGEKGREELPVLLLQCSGIAQRIGAYFVELCADLVGEWRGVSAYPHLRRQKRLRHFSAFFLQ
jgi:hypothetical protein